MHDVSLDLDLTGAGWYEARFGIGDAVLVATVGNSPDPLEELMFTALILAHGGHPEEALWDPEDGGLFVWRLERSTDRVCVRIDYNTELASPSWGDPWIAMDSSCSIGEFCSAVIRCAEGVIVRYGFARYTELAQGAFPSSLLTKLRDAQVRKGV